MKREVYMYLSSDSSNAYYANNTAGQFTVLLPEPLDLDGAWEAALIQFQNPGITTSKQVIILLDIIEDIIFENNKKPIVRRCFLSNQKELITFDSKFYKAIKNSHVDRISIRILDDEGRIVTFAEQNLKCTLHLRKCRL